MDVVVKTLEEPDVEVEVVEESEETAVVDVVELGMTEDVLVLVELCAAVELAVLEVVVLASVVLGAIDD